MRVSREKGFFLLLELVIALLLFLSFYAAVQSYSSENPFSLPARAAEIACYDLLSLWVSGEENISFFAGEIIPSAHISFSPAPIFASHTRAFACHAFRFKNGAEESLYILIEW